MFRRHFPKPLSPLLRHTGCGSAAAVVLGSRAYAASQSAIPDSVQRIAVPDGFSAGGLPTSLQIVCDAGEEALALRIGWAYEQATDWRSRRPPEP